MTTEADEARAALDEVERLLTTGHGVGGRVLVERAAALARLATVRRWLDTPEPAHAGPVEAAAEQGERSLAELEAVLQRVAAGVVRLRSAEPSVAEGLGEVGRTLQASLAEVRRARERLFTEGSPLGGGLPSLPAGPE